MRASRCGDPRDILLTEDAGSLKIGAKTEENEHTFVFNRHPERGCARTRTCARVLPESNAACSRRGGGLMPLSVHDAERLQGFPPGWTMTTRPSAQGSQGEELQARWNALAATQGCVASSDWLAARLADPCSLKFTADAVPFLEPVPESWPSAAFNVGHGRMSALSSPFIRQITEMPCLGNFISTRFSRGAVGASTRPRRVRARDERGWMGGAAAIRSIRRRNE